MMSKTTKPGQASRNKSSNKPSGKSSRRTSARLRRTWITTGVIVALLVLIGLAARWIWQGQHTEVAFTEASRRGQGSLSAVQTFPDAGRSHVLPGEHVTYADDPPTSGPHDPTPVQPGFYRSPHRPEYLVHSLEHGNIVIYYDQPGGDVLKTLRAWAGLYNGTWDGIVVTPKQGLGRTVILTAWTKMLRLDSFNVDAGAAFIDAFRGRGPENAVR